MYMSIVFNILSFAQGLLCGLVGYIMSIFSVLCFLKVLYPQNKFLSTIWIVLGCISIILSFILKSKDILKISTRKNKEVKISNKPYIKIQRIYMFILGVYILLFSISYIDIFEISKANIFFSNLLIVFCSISSVNKKIKEKNRSY